MTNRWTGWKLWWTTVVFKKSSAREVFAHAAAEFEDVTAYPECPAVPEAAWTAYWAGRRATTDQELRQCARQLEAHTEALLGSVMAVW